MRETAKMRRQRLESERVAIAKRRERKRKIEIAAELLRKEKAQAEYEALESAGQLPLKCDGLRL